MKKDSLKALFFLRRNNICSKQLFPSTKERNKLLPFSHNALRLPKYLLPCYSQAHLPSSGRSSCLLPESQCPTTAAPGFVAGVPHARSFPSWPFALPFHFFPE